MDYKIFICGRAGIGKTATIAKLAGATIPDSFCETPGISCLSYNHRLGLLTWRPGAESGTGTSCVVLFRD